jgi:hypothetical protein
MRRAMWHFIICGVKHLKGDVSCCSLASKQTELHAYIYLTELLGFWNFFHRPDSREYETRRFGNWICFRPQVKGEKIPTQLGPLERTSLNHWTTPVRFTQLFNHLRPG